MFFSLTSLPSTSILPSSYHIMGIFTFLSLILNLLQLKYNETNMFEQHPIITRIAVISFIMYCIVRWIKLKYTRHYENYLAYYVPFLVNLLWCLFIASTISLLLPPYVTPLVLIICLVLHAMKSLNWIFMKIDEPYGETEFWRRRVDFVLCYLRRKVNRARRNILTSIACFWGMIYFLVEQGN